MLLILAGSVYLYIPIRSMFDPVSDWGNPDTAASLIHHMTLRQYSGWVHNSPEGLLVSLKLLVISLVKSWSWISLLAVVLGAAVGWRVARPRTVMAILILIASLILSSSHQAVDYEPFYLPPMFASLLLVSNIFTWVHVRELPVLINRTLVAAGFACVLALLFLNYRDMDKSDYTLAEDYGKLILDTAGYGTLFTAGDINSFPVLYLRYAEGYGSRVEVFDRSIRRDALLERASELAGRAFDDHYQAREAVIQAGQSPSFIAKSHYVHEPNWLNSGKPLLSYGILYAVGNAPPLRPRLPEYPADYDPGDPLSRSLLANLDLARGEEALMSTPPDSARMLASYRMALQRMHYEPRAEPVNQIGIYFRRAGLPDLALEAYRMSLEKPLLNPQQRRDIRYNISNVYKDRGNDYHRAGDPANAVASYVEALEHDPADSRLLRNIGLIYLRELNRPEEALRYLNRYLEIEPSNREIRRLVETLTP
jgi:tetratricopeptide (TPR) repeat protein